MNIAGPFLNQHRRRAKKRWYLTYYVRVAGEGDKSVLRRHRPHYETKEAAEADKPRLRDQHAAAGGTAGGVLGRLEVADYQEARSLAPEVPLAELARFWRIHHPRQDTSTIAQLLPTFLTWVEARLGRTRHYEDLSSRVTIFARKFGERIPATITREEFLAWLLGLGKAGRTVLNQKRAVVNFFNWMVLDAKVLEANPLSGIKKRLLPRSAAKEIEFLSLVDVNRYLRAGERYDPELLAHETIQLFAGVRADDEMEDFCGEWVKSSTLEVVMPAEVAKTGRREIIGNLEPNFWEWWQHYGREGLLRPPYYEPRWKRLRVLATIEARDQADELARLPIKTLLARHESRAALQAWPWNARRRTFCTYHVAKHESAARTALILRHRGDAETLHNSYRGLGVTREQGAAYFDLRPNPTARVISPARPLRGAVKRQAGRQMKPAVTG